MHTQQKQNWKKMALAAMIYALFFMSGSMNTSFAETANPFPYSINTGGTSSSGASNPTVGVEAGLKVVKDNLPSGVQKEESATSLILSLVSYGLQFYVYVAVGLIMFFGWKLIISQGNVDERKKAITGIVNIAIGTLIIYLAYGIVTFIINFTSPTTIQKSVDQATTATPPTAQPQK